MTDIVAIGELLVDFTCSRLDGETIYKQNAGGAPANVVCMASKLGASTGFIGKIGRDMFGFYLKKVLFDNKVDTTGLILDPNYSTTLAFIHNDEEGDRDFVFYRSPQTAADLNLRYGEVNRELIDECKIFHFGSLSLSSEPARTATVNAVEYAKMQGKYISYDPNWRPLLWESKEAGIRAMKSAAQYADIIKVSENELQLLTDCGALIPGVAKLLGAGVKIICITQGAKGCIIATAKGIERYPAYKVKSIDTLGSGDSFFGAFLYKLLKLEKSIEELDSEDILEMAMFANACGALCSTKQGAIPAMPSKEDIIKLMETVKPERN
ncbi:MAG: carbohydrate kinase [Huintestinicola sp.]|uniref:carbohydrate kinase family protein n=1 Tax=Huintestinicola sp. TaxID=2981661 RepID=UPI003F0ACE09